MMLQITTTKEPKICPQLGSPEREMMPTVRPQPATASRRPGRGPPEREMMPTVRLQSQAAREGPPRKRNDAHS